jgi:hypothetical protein
MAKKRKQGPTVRGARLAPISAPRARKVAVPPSRARQVAKWVLRGLVVGLVATLVTLSGSLPSHATTGDIAEVILVRTVIYGAAFSLLWYGLDVAQRFWKRTKP